MDDFYDEVLLYVCDAWNDGGEGLSVLLPSQLEFEVIDEDGELETAVVWTFDKRMMWFVEQDRTTDQVLVRFYKNTHVRTIQ